MFEVGLVLLDVELANLHPSLVIIEGMRPVGEDVEEDTSQGKDVDGALHALGYRIGRARGVSGIPRRATSFDILRLGDQLGSLPADGPCIASSANQGTNVVRERLA